MLITADKTDFDVLLYGHETWLLGLRKDHVLNVLKSKVTRRIFGTKKGKSNMVTENEEGNIR
jgi:hypothetical protein